MKIIVWGLLSKEPMSLEKFIAGLQPGQHCDIPTIAYFRVVEVLFSSEKAGACFTI
jgi:hypothetical protein